MSRPYPYACQHSPELERIPVVNSTEADVIRGIFQRYIEIQSPKLIAMELNDRNIKIKQGKKWDTAHVNRILSNHTYVGEIKYKDAICQGEQEAIIERSVWERVKEIQRSIDPQSDHSRRQETIAPLKSVLKCGHCGGAMMPTYSNKGGRRYYSTVSNAVGCS